ncbi:exodeoxyribonuclease VII small subunit [Spiroplasma gladiatoris]|uniref:Exodeoxyribonuclease VII small subunit n=1 Tax=Spiroplasma gladiatoris TaxID=2143 RepID=A0A4P7AJ73_9MOLU|nr:exodeoxyribonuclease VII small subunit [Spiroplasma gladiatoris]QBQ07706.1 exodeoxyribonuclease VII small subunit [Spiroplasma gladiatoris]
MENKSFKETLETIRNISNKLNEPSTSMEEAIVLYKQGTEMIKQAEEQLTKIEGEVKKVLENNQLEDFK